MTTQKTAKDRKSKTKDAGAASTAQIITLAAPPAQIPLDKLTISERNVRRVKAGLTIEGLAESIARRTLLTSLSVRERTNEAGNPTGFYEVQAGGRRLRALQLLAKQGRIAKDSLVPCLIKSGGLAEDDSLAENADREALHPLDLFRAFAQLREKGLSLDDIAAAYRVTTTYVKQLLRLDSASDKLLKAYANDDIDLEQLKAFCVTDNHKRQEEVFKLITKGNAHGSAHNIRRLLTENTIPAHDRRVLFVGLKNYTKAGGTIMRDLFEHDHGGWLQDPDILTRLLNDKLAEAQADIIKDGWKWAEICIDGYTWQIKQGLRSLPEEARFTPKDLKKRQQLADEYDAALEAFDEDSQTADDDQARLDALEAKIDAIDAKPAQYSAEAKATAGAILSLSQKGALSIEYGYVRPEDMPADPDDADAHDASSRSSKPAEYVVAGKPLADRLVHDLTAFKTVAIRNALAQDFSAAFLTTLHAMCLDVFHHRPAHSCAQISLQKGFAVSVPGLGDFAPSKDIETRHDAWEARLPRDPDTLWHELARLNDTERAALFAHCVSLSINAVSAKHSPRRSERLHADQLSGALGLDIAAAGWKTDAENYFSRISKAQILEAVREAKDDQTASLIEHLGKADMAKEAARLIEDTNWLPPVLRTLSPEPVSQDQTGPDDPADAPELPAFLATDQADPSTAAAA